MHLDSRYRTVRNDNNGDLFSQDVYSTVLGNNEAGMQPAVCVMIRQNEMMMQIGQDQDDSVVDVYTVKTLYVHHRLSREDDRLRPQYRK